MVQHKTGNLLDATEDILVHQVNHQGVMGAGLAKVFRNKYPTNFQLYRVFCENNSWEKIFGIGGVLFTEEDGKTIANLFGQRYFGKYHLAPDYRAMKNGFRTISEKAKKENKSVAIPFGIGCGLGNGDWGIVSKTIEEIFRDVDCVIYKLEA